jgi:adenylate cyclase
MTKRFHFKREYVLAVSFVCLALSTISLCGSIYLLKNASAHQIEGAEVRYTSYRVASELRRTSDDLTNMVRLYVVTKNEKYREFFNEILSIRAGESPRPEKYDEIYWDLITDEKVRPRPYEGAQSLTQIMLNQGFASGEFDLLRNAEKRSDELAKLEEKAIGMIRSNSGDRNQAIELVFGEKYMQTKADIMVPIQKFFDLVNHRTLERVSSLNKEVTSLIFVSFLLAIFAAVAMFFSISLALSSLRKAKSKSKLLLQKILPTSITARLDRGEELFVDEYREAAIYLTDLALTNPLKADQLGKIFDEFDKLAVRFNVEIVKIDGGLCIAISRGLAESFDHVIHLADFALAARVAINQVSTTLKTPIETRTGMAYGTIITSVIGRERFAFDVWGDGFTKANQIKSVCIPGEIYLTEQMALLIENDFVVEVQSAVEVKDEKTKTYRLQGRKS